MEAGGGGERGDAVNRASWGRRGEMRLTAPVSMSYMRVPKLHQSTALPCPIRCRISGALLNREGGREGEGGRE